MKICPYDKPVLTKRNIDNNLQMTMSVNMSVMKFQVDEENLHYLITYGHYNKTLQ